MNREFGIEDNTFRLLRLPEVKMTVGLGRSSIYRMVGEGNFPRPVHLSLRAVAWSSKDIENWVLDRVQSSSPAAPVIVIKN